MSDLARTGGADRVSDHLRRLGLPPYSLQSSFSDASTSLIAPGLKREKITHGRHCTCSACARSDWTKIDAPCGMHGERCPAVYAPFGPAGTLAAALVGEQAAEPPVDPHGLCAECRGGRGPNEFHTLLCPRFEPVVARSPEEPEGAVNYVGQDESVECSYPGCTNRLGRSSQDVPQFCSKEHRDAPRSSENDDTRGPRPKPHRAGHCWCESWHGDQAAYWLNNRPAVLPVDEPERETMKTTECGNDGVSCRRLDCGWPLAGCVEKS